MKGKLLVASVVLIALICSLAACVQNNGSTGRSSGEDQHVELTNLEQFDSYHDIEDFLQENQELSSGSGSSTGNLSSTQRWKDHDGDTYVDQEAWGEAVPTDSAGDDDDDSSSGGGKDYSTTNVQEKMVDEGDILKNDAEYAYVVSADNKKVIIMDVHPAENAEIVSEIEIDEGSIIELYLNGDKLVVVGRTSSSYYYDDYYYGRSSRYTRSVPEIFVETYYIKDRDDPVLYRNDTIKGNFITSRMIGNYLYIVSSLSSWQVDNESALPVPAHDVFYLDYYDNSYTFTSVTSINVHTTMMMPQYLTILLGASSDIYVSTNNIYLTKQKRLSWVEKKELEIEQVITPLLPEYYAWDVNDTMNSDDLTRSEKLDRVNDIVGEYTETLTDEEKETFFDTWQQKEQEFNVEIAPDIEKTYIYRITIRNEFVFFRAMGKVDGYVLNRFSMGEHNDHFRLATSLRADATNRLYVLDMSLTVVGSILNIAPGEKIYSARFLGDRAYLVTFKWIDPFFVIDLSDPYAPQILGELKIPGYSNYLHPYDENHVIGIGKEVDASIDEEKVHSDNAVYYTAVLGVKISLFDVTDVNNPKEISKYIIGDRGTDSLALSDSHAFLFSLSKNLLVIPVSLYEHSSSDAPLSERGAYIGEFAYVFDISSDEGISLNGRISHSEEDEVNEDYWWSWNSEDSVRRSFYIDDVIYTLSNSKLKANDMDTLEDISSVDLPYESNDDYYWDD